MIMPESQEKWESKDEAKSGVDLALFWSSIGDTPRQRNVTPSSSLHMTDKSFNAGLRRRCWWGRAPSRNSEWDLMESREKIRTCPLIARLYASQLMHPNYPNRTSYKLAISLGHWVCLIAKDSTRRIAL
jgi:hypothetical protein